MFFRDDLVVPVTLAAAMVDLAADRGVAPDRILSGTRIFYTDIVNSSVRHVSASDVSRMLLNAERHFRGGEFPFLLGHRIFPQALGPLANALVQARTVGETLRLICRFQALFSPLQRWERIMAPRRGPRDVLLVLHDTIGLGAAAPLLDVVMVTAFFQIQHRLLGEKPGFRFFFSQAEPEHIEQYDEYLGTRVTFDAPATAILVPAEWHDAPISNTSPTLAGIARVECLDRVARLRCDVGFVGQVYRMLRDNVDRPLRLEDVAARLDMSQATLKRRLKKHGVSFQQLADRARLHVFLYHMLFTGMSVETAARAIAFDDVSNFRRSFKRWTGEAPRALMEKLSHV